MKTFTIETKNYDLIDTCTITRHGQNDYDIYWHNGDCSTRGTATDILDEFCCEALDKVKEFAEENMGLEKPTIIGKHPWIAVSNPWYDESARFELSDEDALEEWGMETVFDFCNKAKEII